MFQTLSGLNVSFQIESDNSMNNDFKVRETQSHLKIKNMMCNMSFNINLSIILYQSVVNTGQGFRGSTDPSLQYTNDKRPLARPNQLSSVLIIDIPRNIYQNLANTLQAKISSLKITDQSLNKTFRCDRLHKLNKNLLQVILTVHNVDLEANMPQLKEILTLFT